MVQAFPDPVLVWLVGPSASGKTTWARSVFPSGAVVTSDVLRSMVGTGERDLDASADAFAVLESIASARLARRLTTVVDTLGTDLDLADRLRRMAESFEVPAVAAIMQTPPSVCRERNRSRRHPVPARVLSTQLGRMAEVRRALEGGGWTSIEVDEGSEIVVERSPGIDDARRRHVSDPDRLAFHLVLSDFSRAGDLGSDLVATAAAAEEAGFEGLAVMDHLLQIPQVGREWDPMPEAYTTLGYLAGATDRLRLSALVTNVAFRHPSLLAKILATLDVLSGGRAECGLGAGWHRREMDALGMEFRPAAARLDLLVDTIGVLRTMWAPGAHGFQGLGVSVEEAVGYPRPVAGDLPIIVGGGGERRTLRIVAQHADGCNLTSDLDVLPHKLDVLRRHCAEVDRPFEEILVTVLDITICGADPDDLADRIEQGRGRRPAAAHSARLNAGLVTDQIGRYRLLAEAGVQRVYVALDRFSGVDDIATFAPVVQAFT